MDSVLIRMRDLFWTLTGMAFWLYAITIEELAESLVLEAGSSAYVGSLYILP